MEPDEFVECIKYALKVFGRLRKKVQFDAIAFTGSSGAAIAFNIAAKFNIPLIYVRKSGEKSHGVSIECNAPIDHSINRYLIVDDFICSGNTVDGIIRKINHHTRKNKMTKLEPVGVFLFYEKRYIDRADLCFDVGELPIYTTWTKRK